MRWRTAAGAVLCAAVLVLLLDLAVVTVRADGGRTTAAAKEDDGASPWGATMFGSAVPAELVPPDTTPPTEPPTTTTTTTPPPPPARPGTWTLGPYQGTGVWIDVYDWTAEMTGGAPRVNPVDIEHMADLGIQTLFVQTAHRRSPADVMEPDRLNSLIEVAHRRGMAVVAWYLPMLEDTALDLRRLVAASQLPVDGLGVDIESLAVVDPADRTRRLLELSTALRQAVGPRAISAITPSAVHLQVVNPNFWPGFPWAELGATYDVIVPMSYWSVRKTEWRQGERYTAENIDRIRAATRPDMPIHLAGGIADGISIDDVTGMIRAIQARGILGGSLYDWNTSQPWQWDLLRALRVA